MLGCEEMSEYWRNYLRNDADAHEPARLPAARVARGLPPAFLAIAECDILAEQSVEMAAGCGPPACPRTSVVYPGASHSFIEAMSIAAVSNQALADASVWLGQAFPGPARGRRPEAVA